MADYKFTSHRLRLNKDLEESTATALEVIGQLAEGYAKATCSGFVDTGRLMNSISHATVDYSGQGTYRDRQGNSFDDATNTEPIEKTDVLIFTNVEYAVFQEYGTSTGIKPKHFMKKAAEGHKAEYQQILAEYIKK